ncbi:hypothetical protein ACLIR7_08895 [Nitratireductor aquimarinus]|uniref:hypothetical protein n=1 Tax=Nitratireductor aquimarinus TaxID=889300 RepID=UPI00398EA77F
MCNQDHIRTARAALARAAWVRGGSPAYNEDAVTDLLADLRHHCVAAGLDFARCERIAAMYFMAENGGAS